MATSLALGVAVAQSKVNETDAPKRGNNLYIVRLAHAPVVAYTGGVAGLKATKPGLNKKIDPNSSAVIDYSNYLRGKHDAAIAGAGGGRKVYSYVNVFNGFAAELSDSAVAALRANPDVLRVEKDQIQQLDTFSTPQFLGIPGGIWQQLGGPERAGEDVIVGVIDSGVWPENPSFSDRDITNPHDNRVVYRQIPGWNGKCEPGEAFAASH
ncbi:MAG: protease inhibitor I9 family protein [Deltaproteobacteria bacterium]|nr:protease inhibitor I9 family protein [Deltaproteobacteria bacterium]